MKYLLEENAKLREQLAASQRLVYDIQYTQAELKQRAEATEAKLKAASEQEPVDFFCNATRFKADSDGVIKAWPELAGRWVALVPAEDSCHLRYAAPIPPVDVQELQQRYDFNVQELKGKQQYILHLEFTVTEQQKRIAELESELSELTARFNAEVCGASHMGEPVIPATHFETAEWPHLERQAALAQAREEGRKAAVPDGWKVVPKEPTDAMVSAASLNGAEGSPYEICSDIRVAIEAAPTPGEKE